MASLNKVILMGNVTRDPELRYSPEGRVVVKFSIAITSGYKNSGTKEWIKTVDFVPIVVFSKQAENIAKYITKGNPVLVDGKVHQSTWTTEEGKKRSRLEIIANNVQFLYRAAQNSSNNTTQVAKDENITSTVEEKPNESEKDDVPF